MKFVALLSTLKDTAATKGYLLTFHGRLNRDIDVLVVPWTQTAVTAEEVVQTLSDALTAFSLESVKGPEENEHGRRTWYFGFNQTPGICVHVLPRC